MELLVVSFVAGVLTVLAPCILPVLPIIIGGATGQRQGSAPFVITASLCLSVIIFTLLLKASTALLGLPIALWQIISGSIIVALGVITVWPQLWEQTAAARRANASSGKLLGAAGQQKGFGRDILIGAALGPVFSSCSPTYAFIVAAVLPQSFGQGLGYLTAYAVGLAGVLLLLALAGQAAVHKLGWAANPTGWFKHAIGVLFILVGVAILFGIDKDLQTFILEKGLYAPIERLEESLR